MTPKAFPSTAALAAILLSAAAAASPRGTETSGGRMTYDPATERYCLEAKQSATGTRLRTRECKTSAQWKVEGLTVSRK